MTDEVVTLSKHYRALTLDKDDLRLVLLEVSQHIGQLAQAGDLAKLRDAYIAANALWARIGRLDVDPQDAA
jgi:hypothetical protein